MLKIIVAIDSLKPSKSAVEHALNFSKSLNAHLVGVFLDDISNRSYKSYQMLHNSLAISQEVYDTCNEQDDTLRKESVVFFEHAAAKEKINYTVHHDRHFSLNELTEESKYADLLIIEKNETFSQFSENSPTHFIRDLLRETHCPVLIVPGHYEKIGKVVMLYDGESHATEAIKKFSYVFPVSNSEPVEVITVKSTKQRGSHVPNNHLMKEFMKRHYPDATFTVLKGFPEIEIVNYLKLRHPHELIVLGAYHRGKISRMMNPSVIEVLLQELNSPLFINNN